MSDGNSWQRAEFLQRESHQLDSAMRNLQGQMVNILLGTFTVGTASAAALVQFSKFEIILVIPVILPLAWITGTRLLAELFALAAQRRAVENEISVVLKNLGSDAGFRPWESLGGSNIARSVANVGLYIWFALLSLLLGVTCLVVAWRHGAPESFDWIALAVFTLGAVVALLSGFSALNIFRRFPQDFPAT